ncbi:MAG: hypothetical protein JSU04_07680 [Bdellovibrionales bacterium]|nr:hypothetical protein [Bdellovibrionales bacterium]
MINGRKNLATILALTATTALVSCGKKDADKIGEAQLCLDKATQATAAECKAMVDGIEKTGAYAIRCSANFIAEGFTQPARFKQAFDAFDNNSTSNTEAFMSVMTFKNSGSTVDENLTVANQTFEYCNKTGSKGLMLLGTMASTSTTLAKVANALSGTGTTPTSTDINNALNDLKNNPSSGTNAATISAIGTVVSSTYAASCQSGSASNQSICEQLDEALNGVNISDPAAVGAAVIAKWSN